MSVLSSITRLWGGAVLANGSAHRIEDVVNYRIEPRELPYASLYGLLKTLYLSTGAYDDLANARVILGRNAPQMKSIRNPIAPVVGAWGSKLYPSPITVKTTNAAIVDPLARVWKWSNWRAKQSTFAKFVALYGEAFHKVQADPIKGRVWWEYLEPMYVTEWEEDPRGYLTYIRVDILRSDEDGPTRTTRTHTEVWDGDEQTYRRWETEGDACQRALKDLGAPVEEIPFETFGIDFVPFVRTPFADIGEKRAIGAVQLALESIFEADLSATNLHGMLYVDGDGAWVATAAGTDASGRPVPPLRVATAEPTFDAFGRQTSNGTGTQADGSITVGKRSFWRLPPGYDLKSVVADINYAAALAILQDHDEHLERLIPALAYARISELSGGDLSGRAIRFKLTPFVDQVTEVRATALEKLAQADAMALTLGKVNGIDGFSDLGDFDQGDFEHEFEEQEIIPIGDYEAAQTEVLEAQAYAAWTAAGFPDVEALHRLKYTKTEAARIVRLATQDAEAAMARQQQMMGEQEQDDEDEQP
jgi:hypothetical protein